MSRSHQRQTDVSRLRQRQTDVSRHVSYVTSLSLGTWHSNQLGHFFLFKTCFILLNTKTISNFIYERLDVMMDFYRCNQDFARCGWHCQLRTTQLAPATLPATSHDVTHARGFARRGPRPQQPVMSRLMLCVLAASCESWRGPRPPIASWCAAHMTPDALSFNVVPFLLHILSKYCAHE